MVLELFLLVRVINLSCMLHLSIDVCGEYASPELTPISLNEGWNMVGYLRIDPAPADLVLEEIATDGNLVIAKDYLGLAYLPEWNFNAIGDMQATQGYQIKSLKMIFYFIYLMRILTECLLWKLLKTMYLTILK